MKRELTTESLIFTPDQASNLSIKLIDKVRQDAGGGVRFGVPDIDKDLVPLRSGQLVVVMGRPGHYKSGLMNWFSKQAVAQIAPDNVEDIVVRVTWEQSVEEDTLSYLAGMTNLSITQMARGEIGDKEFEVLKAASYKRQAMPVWIMGHSQQSDIRRARPAMTMTDVALGLEMIANGEIDGVRHNIRMVVLDYLQRIKPDERDGHTKREQMMAAVDRAKDCAISFSCPVLLGVQAGRDVDGRDDRLPRLDDGQETSNIEQSADVMLSVYYPYKYADRPGQLYGQAVTPNLLFVGLIKQKLGEYPFRYGLHFQPDKNIIKGLAARETH